MSLGFEDACRESAYELEQIESICNIAIGSIDNDVCEVKIQDIGILLDIISEKIKILKNKLYDYAECASKSNKNALLGYSYLKRFCLRKFIS